MQACATHLWTRRRWRWQIETLTVSKWKKREHMFNKWFIITLVLTSQPTLILRQNLWHTPQLLSQRVCVVTPKTSPFWGMTQTIFVTGSQRYCTSTGIIVGGKCQQHPNDSVLRINKTHELNSQEDYQSDAEGKSSNPGRHSGKPQFILRGSEP